jgi:photosystem II stability/assembly factor-like uncharacterized protein
LKNFAQYKLASFANQVRLICVVCFSLVGCSKYDQQPETIDVAYHLHGLWARNAAQVWVVGDAGEILHSTDGGEHWQPQKSGARHQLSSVCASASGLPSNQMLALAFLKEVSQRPPITQVIAQLDQQLSQIPGIIPFAPT